VRKNSKGLVEIKQSRAGTVHSSREAQINRWEYRLATVGFKESKLNEGRWCEEAGGTGET